MKNSEKVEILVTGFGPFEDVDPNPSAVVAEQLCSLGIAHKTIILPTSFARSATQIKDLITQFQPKILLMLGYSSKAQGLKIETTARDLQLSTRSDIDGKTIKTSGEAKPDLVTNLDVSKIAAFLDEQGITHTISTDAGNYVCEHAYYTAIQKIRQDHEDTKCLFVHIGDTDAINNLVRNLSLLAQTLL